ncbi:MAG: hypothetical protein V4568_08510 [Pseudomonadota bacterium]
MDAQADPAGEMSTDTLLGMISRQTGKTEAELTQIAKRLILEEFLDIDKKNANFELQGVSKGFANILKELAMSPLSVYERDDWIAENLSNTADDMQAMLTRYDGKKVALGIDSNGALSKDLTLKLFESVMRLAGPVLADGELKSEQQISQDWQLLGGDSGYGDNLGAAIMQLPNKELVGLEYVDDVWHLINPTARTDAGWQPYEKGSRFRLTGDTEEEQREAITGSLKIQFNLTDDDPIAFMAGHRPSGLHTRILGQEIKESADHAATVPYLSRHDSETHALYGTLLGFPQQNRIEQILDSLNVVDVDEALLDELLSKTDLKSKAVSVSEETPTETHAFNKEASKARIYELFRQTQPLKDWMHEAIYVEMLTLSEKQRVIFLKERKLTNLNGRALIHVEQQLNEIQQLDPSERTTAFSALVEKYGIERMSTPEFDKLPALVEISDAFSTVSVDNQSDDSDKALYQSLLLSDDDICGDLLLEKKNEWEIDQDVLTAFSQPQQATITRIFANVDIEKELVATMLYDDILVESDEQKRGEILKDKKISRLHRSALENNYPIADQQKILEAFIPVARDDEASEYLYRTLLTLDDSARRTRLLKDKNAWQVNEDALAKLPAATHAIIRTTFDETQSERDASDLATYQAIAGIADKSGRLDRFESSGITRINKRTLSTLDAEEQTVVLQTATAALTRKFSNTDPGESVSFQNAHVTDAELARLAHSIPSEINEPLTVEDLPFNLPPPGRTRLTALFNATDSTGQDVVLKRYLRPADFKNELRMYHARSTPS